MPYLSLHTTYGTQHSGRGSSSSTNNSGSPPKKTEILSVAATTAMTAPEHCTVEEREMSGRGCQQKNTRGRPRQSENTATTPASAAQSFCKGSGGAGRGNLASSDLSSRTVSARRTPASAVQPSSSGDSSSAGTGDRNHVRRSVRQDNAFVTPRTTTRSVQGSSKHSILWEVQGRLAYVKIR